MAHATIRLTNVKPKKHVVRFDYYSDETEREDQKPQLITSIYINKDVAKKELGVDLKKVRGVEISVRALK